MKFELDLVRQGRTPVIPADLATAARTPSAPARRAVREATDAILRDAPDLQTLIATSAAAMLDVATVLDERGHEPDTPDFREAVAAMVETARSVIDKGLQLDDAATVLCGAVMLELTTRGMFAALGQDYEAALRAVHSGEEPPIKRPGADDGEEQAGSGAGGPGGDPGIADHG